MFTSAPRNTDADASSAVFPDGGIAGGGVATGAEAGEVEVATCGKTGAVFAGAGDSATLVGAAVLGVEVATATVVVAVSLGDGTGTTEGGTTETVEEAVCGTDAGAAGTGENLFAKTTARTPREMRVAKPIYGSKRDIFKG
ncbi:MAG: hypothetical protein ACHQU0_00290 [Candidatus Paceibacteria bacterium]